MKQRESERSIKFRLANYTDARALADLHYVCSMEQPNGFMFLLGRRFLITYYQLYCAIDQTLSFAQRTKI